MADALDDKLGYVFKDRDLLKRALTHAGANHSRSNERLEFLGDRVLGIVVARTLYDLYPDEQEGSLTHRLHALVRWEACARVGEALGLWDHLVLTKSEMAGAGGRGRGPIVGSACEAIIAAIYLDGGFAAAKDFILRFWDFRNFEPEMRDAKTRLQEWAQARGKDAAAPVYQVVSRDGPDHAPHFVIEVRVPGHDPARGEGGSKRDAEQDAAGKLLSRVTA